MNDRYMLRAKRIDNGEWVEGYLVIYPSGKSEIHKKCVEPPDVLAIYEVDQSTICQCTGLCDENGKKIYESDIVGFIDYSSTENGYSEHYCRGQAAWDEETASFQVTERFSAENYEVLNRGCKVIGNIFDTPEMLEEL